MWIVVLVLTLLGAQLNLTAIVPLQAGDAPPPWWVGGRDHDRAATERWGNHADPPGEPT